MIHYVLATDYDGTIAHDGQVGESTIAALTRLRDSGRTLLMVTGRRLDDLLSVFPHAELFECIVAENGALLYWPECGEAESLAPPPPPLLLSTLAKMGVAPIEVGRVIVATWTPHEAAVLRAIRELHLELQIIFNKGAVMILPTGVNKAFGLRTALNRLGYSPVNTVAVGDAENDESMLRMCGISAAVANALPAVKDRVDLVLQQDHGAGVEELTEKLLADDLRPLATRRERGIHYGVGLSGRPLVISNFGESLLVVGGPGGGKSRFATGLWERIDEEGYQTCIIDPEGDYQTVQEGIIVGTRENAPTGDEVLQVLKDPAQDCVVSLFSMPKRDRPAFFARLLRTLLEHRGRTGRPHWIIVDEAHYAAPANWRPADEAHLTQLQGMIFITAFPERLSDAVFAAASRIVAVGDEPERTLRDSLRRFSPPPDVQFDPRGSLHHVSLTWRRGEELATWFRGVAPQGEFRRHEHDHLEGDLEEPLRFRFRGPQQQVNLPAQNLTIFIQLAQGVDEPTWEYHLRQHDYSRWLRDVIKEEEVAARVEEIESNYGLSHKESRDRVVAAIESHFDSSSMDSR